MILELIAMVRSLIGDLDTDEQFSDERISKAIATAAIVVGREYSLAHDYIVDLMSDQITPNPIEVQDWDAVALITLKAACILNQNQYLGAVRSGIRVRDGSSQVDTTGSFSGYKDILTVGPCGSYAALIKKLTASGAARGGRGRAVMSPYSTGSSGIRGNWIADKFFGRYLGAFL